MPVPPHRFSLAIIQVQLTQAQKDTVAVGYPASHPLWRTLVFPYIEQSHAQQKLFPLLMPDRHVLFHQNHLGHENLPVPHSLNLHDCMFLKKP